MAEGEVAETDNFATTWTVYNPPYAILKWNIKNITFARNLIISPQFLINRTTWWYIEMHPEVTIDEDTFVVFCLKMSTPSRISPARVKIKGEFTVHGPPQWTQIFFKLFSGIYRDGFEFRIPKVCFAPKNCGRFVEEIHLVRCEMVISVEKQKTQDWDTHLKKLSEDLHRLFMSTKFSDFDIRMTEDSIGVHKVFLSARSKELSEVLTFYEKYCFMIDKASILRAVLLFVYTGDPNLVLYSVPVELFSWVAVVAAKLKINELANLMTPVKISCITTLGYKDFLYTWHLRNFRNLSYDSTCSIRSEEFASDSTTRWQLVLSKRSGTYGLHLVRVYSKIESHRVDVKFTMYNKISQFMMQNRQNFVLFPQKNELGFSSFAEESYVNSKLLEDDVLFIECKIKFWMDTESRFELQENLVDVCEDWTTLKYLKSLSRDLKMLYSSGEGSDLTLLSGQGSMKVHSWLLWARSPYFQDKLKDSSVQFLTVPVESGILKDILLYLYSGEVPPLNCERALNMYAACHPLGLLELKTVCRDFIMKNLNVHIVLEVIAIAHDLCDPNLEKYSVDFVCVPGNARMILETRRWREFTTKNHDIALTIYHRLAWERCNRI